MKKLYTLLTAVILTASAFAQAPEGMSYQAVVRDAGNALVISQAVGMQISILQGSVSGTAVYIETQTPTTNINGLVSIEIGSGTVISGTFNTIDWSNGPYFIETETDPTGGTTYTITGTSQLMSVPYALHANTADSIVGGVSVTETDPIFGASLADGITALDTANWNNHTVDTDTQLDSTGVAASGYVAGPHTVDTDTQLDSTGIATLGYVSGPHTVDTDTQLDSTGVAALGFVSGPHTVDTQLDSTGVAALGFVAGPHTIDTDTQLDSTDIASLGYVSGPHTVEIDGSVTNEIQTISRTGTTVTLSNGGGSYQDSLNTYTGANGIDITGTVVSEMKYQVGDFAQGGIVFWVDETGEHGLVCAKTDQSTGIQWFNGIYTDNEAKGDGLLSGEMNTILLITALGSNSNNYAAGVCANLQIAEGGETYGDWYLPSKEELNQMYLNKATIDAIAIANGGSGFADWFYWSSTRFPNGGAWVQYLSSGAQFDGIQLGTLPVRAIRAF